MPNGQCLCGAVRFEAKELGGFGVCHCKQCQQWSGSALFGITVPEAAMKSTQGEETLAEYMERVVALKTTTDAVLLECFKDSKALRQE